MNGVSVTFDWTWPEAVFSLGCHARLSAGDLSARLGVRRDTVTKWWQRGCLKVGLYGPALDRLSRQVFF